VSPRPNNRSTTARSSDDNSGRERSRSPPGVFSNRWLGVRPRQALRRLAWPLQHATRPWQAPRWLARPQRARPSLGGHLGVARPRQGALCGLGLARHLRGRPRPRRHGLAPTPRHGWCEDGPSLGGTVRARPLACVDRPPLRPARTARPRHLATLAACPWAATADGQLGF
jgi:hypothetical protein